VLLTVKHFYAEFSKARVYLRYCVRFVNMVGYHGVWSSSSESERNLFLFSFLIDPSFVCSRLLAIDFPVCVAGSLCVWCRILLASVLLSFPLPPVAD